MRDLQKMIGENINQYTRFYPKTYPPMDYPLTVPNHWDACSNVVNSPLVCSVEFATCYSVNQHVLKGLPVIVSLHALSVQQINVFEVYIKHILSS